MSNNWNTPEEVLERVRKIAPVGLDPCSNQGSTVGAIRAIELPEDGLNVDWRGHGLTFCNPPYLPNSELAKWGRKMKEEAEKGTEIVFVVPANLETKAWHSGLWGANALCFPDKRIRFSLGGKLGGSPRFASAVGYFGHRKMAFFDAFKDYGKVIFP